MDIVRRTVTGEYETGVINSVKYVGNEYAQRSLPNQAIAFKATLQQFKAILGQTQKNYGTGIMGDRQNELLNKTSNGYGKNDSNFLCGRKDLAV